MKKLLTIATITSAMFLAGCQSATVQTLPTAPGEPTVQIPMWKSTCDSIKNNFFRPLREVVNIKPIDNATCMGRKLHAGEMDGYHRDEMRTESFKTIFHKETHIFEADISINAKSNITRKMFIKQIHSGTPGHVASLELKPSTDRTQGSIRLVGQFKPCATCRGVSGRVTSAPAARWQDPLTIYRDDNLVIEPDGKVDWKLDGTEYHLKVVHEFDETGGFWTHVYVDGNKIVSGYSNYPRGEGYEDFLKQKELMHKFGIYGAKFPVEAVFSNVSLKYIKNDN